MGILEKNIIFGSANASPNMIFFKDPIYFRITHLSVYITNIIHLAATHRKKTYHWSWKKYYKWWILKFEIIFFLFIPQGPEHCRNIIKFQHWYTVLFSLNFDSIETNMFIFKYDDVFSFVEKILFHLMDRKQHLISEK